MLASDFINGADGIRVMLLDSAKATWSDVELLGYLNQALRTTAELKPDAYVRREYVAMVAGTRQELPAGGLAIFDTDENEDSGREATLVEKSLLDHQNRFWPAATPEVDVQHWCADPRDPRRFYVTPPNDGTGSVSCTFGAVPDAVALGGQIPLGDSYHYALRCFALAQAYSKNSKRQDLAKVAGLMQEFRQTLGIRNQAQAAVAPTVARENTGG